MLVVEGYYAFCGVYCVLMWISTSVVGYYACCGGLLCLVWWYFLHSAVNKKSKQKSIDKAKTLQSTPQYAKLLPHQA